MQKNNWQTKKLGEVFDIKPSKDDIRKRLKNNDLVSFVPMEDLGILKKEFTINKERRLGDVIDRYTYFANEDLLLAKITPCFENGKIGIARNLNNGVGFGSSEYIVFRSTGKIISDYLFYFLCSERFRNEGKNRMSGAVGHKRVAKDFIENFEIKYPESITEQKRIIKKLDDIFEKIDKMQNDVKKNLQNNRNLFESYLNDIFSNPSDNWEFCDLNTYVKFIDYRGRTPTKTEQGMRLITAKNVKLGYIQTYPEEFVDPKIYDKWMVRGVPNKGDVLFTTEAPLANVAQLDTDEKVVFAQRIIIFQPDINKINQTFLKYLLLSNPIRQRIIEKGTGATAQGIKSSLLKKIQIYFPNSMSEQKKIIERIDEISNQTKKLEEIYKQKLTDLEELKKSILNEAFSGRL